MRKIILFIIILLICGRSFAPSDVIAEKQVPPYAKWGNIAVTQTIKKYPEANVVDYLHIGREEKSDKIAVEKFKLWLRQNKREFGVYVNVEFDKNTNVFKSISFKETDH